MIEKINSLFDELGLEKSRLTDSKNTIQRSLVRSNGIVFNLYFTPTNSCRGLSIELNEDFPKMAFEVESKGFNYKLIEQCIYIEEKGDYLTNIFKVFVSELVPEDKIVNTSLYLDSLKKKVVEWRDFFQDIKKVEVTQDFIKGLVGELSYLKHLILKQNISSLDIWTGPSGSRSDFFVDNARVEVKTTSSTNPVKIRISSLKQLELDEDDLFIVLYELIANEGGLSLELLVDDLKNLIFKANLCVATFYRKLEVLGCTSEVLEQTKNTKYKISNKSKYCVVEGFPKLEATNISRGIVDVKYSILKDEINDYLVEFS